MTTTEHTPDEPTTGQPTTGQPTTGQPNTGEPQLDTEGHRFVPVDERPPIGSPGPGPAGAGR